MLLQSHIKNSSLGQSQLRQPQSVVISQLLIRSRQNVQNPSQQTPPRNKDANLPARNIELSGQNKASQLESHPLSLKLVNLVQKFTKGIQLQINKHHQNALHNTIELKLDGLMMQRLKDINELIAEFRQLQLRIPNPEFIPNNVDFHKHQPRPAQNNIKAAKRDSQAEDLRSQMSGWIRKHTSLVYLQNKDLSQLFRIVAHKNEELLRQKCQLQSENKKIRLFYLNQIEHYKEEVKFVHEVLQAQQLELKNLQKQCYSSYLLEIASNANTEQKAPENNMQETARFTEEEDSRSAEVCNQNAEVVYKLTEKLLRQYEELKAQQEQKQQHVLALAAQINLLEENLSELSEKVQAKEELLAQKAQILQELQSQIEAQRGQLKSLQSQMACLREEAIIEHQNVEYIQQQLQFMEQQRELIAQEIEELQAQKQAVTQTNSMC